MGVTNQLHTLTALHPEKQSVEPII